MFAILVFFLVTTLPAFFIMRKGLDKNPMTLGDKVAVGISFVILMGFCAVMVHLAQYPLTTM